MDYKPSTFFTDLKDLHVISDGILVLVVSAVTLAIVLIFGPKNVPTVYITEGMAKSLAGYPDHIEGCYRTSQAYPAMPYGEVNYMFKCEVNDDKNLLNVPKDSR